MYGNKILNNYREKNYVYSLVCYTISNQLVKLSKCHVLCSCVEMTCTSSATLYLGGQWPWNGAIVHVIELIPSMLFCVQNRLNLSVWTREIIWKKARKKINMIKCFPRQKKKVTSYSFFWNDQFEQSFDLNSKRNKHWCRCRIELTLETDLSIATEIIFDAIFNHSFIVSLYLNWTSFQFIWNALKPNESTI